MLAHYFFAPANDSTVEAKYIRKPKSSILCNESAFTVLYCIIKRNTYIKL